MTVTPTLLKLSLIVLLEKPRTFNRFVVGLFCWVVCLFLVGGWLVDWFWLVPLFVEVVAHCAFGEAQNLRSIVCLFLFVCWLVGLLVG